MGNQVLWTLDNETSARTLERLCVDLLYRTGYKDIVPIEPQDGGRDAEQNPRPGRGQAGEAAFFQFSSEANWKKKLHRDARKLRDGGFDFSTLVFVTTRAARGVDIDAISEEFLEKYNWVLIVYEREWLRLQLEEAHPDLAKKYLGVEAPDYSPRLSARMHFGKSSDTRLVDAWRAFKADQFERAAVEFKEFLSEHDSTNREVLEALAWCQYRVYRYDEALASINRALAVEATVQGRSIRGCVLVEKGIRGNDRSSLIEGRRLFEQILESERQANWHSLYDLGNVESALGNHAKAIELYCRALDIDGNQPEVWKNLGTAYHHVGNHETEMECLDQVLRIDPDKVEALVSKGTSLMLDLNKAGEAIPLLERALRLQQDWAVHWPHIWYWTAEAHHRVGHHKEALAHIENGLAHQPGNAAMKRLKSDLLVELVRTDSRLVHEARGYWQTRLAEQPRDFATRERLVRLEIAHGDPQAAWTLLEECLALLDLGPTVQLRQAGFGVEECLTALRFLPQYRLFRRRMPVAGYWNTSDPLYDLGFPPPDGTEVQAALATFLAVPFGLAFDAFENTTTDRNSVEALRNLADVLRPLVERAIVQSARQLAVLIPPRDSGAEAVADSLTNVLLFLGLLAMREFSRQFGWIPSQFRVSGELVAATLTGSEVNRVRAKVVTDSLIAIGKESRLFPEPAG